MTNYNERLDWILHELQFSDIEKPGVRGKNAVQAKQHITSLIKELVAEAKPEVKAHPLGPVTLADCQRGLDQYEANLLKALDEV